MLADIPKMAFHYRGINYDLHRFLRYVSHPVAISIPRLSFLSFIIPDFPHTTRWLSAEERAMATKRLQHASGSHDTERGSVFSGIKMAVLDYKVWLLA